MEQGLPSNVILSLSRDHSGTLWAGTTAGLAEFRDGQFVPPEGDPAVIRKPVQALINYRDQSLIVATEGGGLYRLADRKLEPLNDFQQSPHDIDAFYLDHDNLLWTAIRGRGLGFADGQKIAQFTVKDGLYDDDIFGIAGDDEGRLWMACSRGIFSVARTDLKKFAAGEITRLTSFPFSPTDALRHQLNTTGWGSACHLEDAGRLRLVFHDSWHHRPRSETPRPQAAAAVHRN